MSLNISPSIGLKKKKKLPSVYNIPASVLIIFMSLFPEKHVFSCIILPALTCLFQRALMFQWGLKRNNKVPAFFHLQISAGCTEPLPLSFKSLIEGERQPVKTTETVNAVVWLFVRIVCFDFSWGMPGKGGSERRGGGQGVNPRVRNPNNVSKFLSA